jgi:hypothetical protein
MARGCGEPPQVKPPFPMPGYIPSALGINLASLSGPLLGRSFLFDTPPPARRPARAVHQALRPF